MQQVERKRTKLTSRQQHQRTAESGADATLSGEQLSHEPLQTSATSSSTSFSDKTPRKNNLSGGVSPGLDRRKLPKLLGVAGPAHTCSQPARPANHSSAGGHFTTRRASCVFVLGETGETRAPRVPTTPSEQRLIHMLMIWHGEAARAPDRDNTSLFPGSGMNQSRHRVVVGGALAVVERLGGFFAIPSLSQ